MGNPIRPIDPAKALGVSKQLLGRLERRIGRLPASVLVVANSSNALRGYLSFFGALRSAGLPARLCEQIALLVSEINRCEYGIAEHSFFAHTVGVSDSDIVASRQARSSTPRFEAALGFVQVLLAARGHAGDAELLQLREAEFTDGQIVEIIGHTALNAFTSYLANASQLPASSAVPTDLRRDTLLAS
jgi:AhpD family alkylhydroperoxidase